MNDKNGLLSHIKKSLGFLEIDYDFSLREERSGFYYFESDNCQILVILEHKKIHMGIGPIGSAKTFVIQNGTRAGRIDIKIISSCLDPAYTFEDVPWNSEVDIPAELKHYSVLIKKYCQKMMRGDFSQWSMIRDCVKKQR